MKLSIIIPAYNEEATISSVVDDLEKIRLTDVEKEVIIVDDGSKDNTPQVLQQIKKKYPRITILEQPSNQGKGRAVVAGIKIATGEYILIQDADREYHPDQIPLLLAPIQKGQTEVVYGTRLKRMPNFKRDERNVRFFIQYVGNKVLSLITSVLYGQWITDMETGYKLFPKKALEGVTLHARSFELEPEITAKLMKKGYRIIEVPISTNPRTQEEGKKLSALRDGPIALWSLFKYRFVN
jgi:dolichol-phosphate mannosyltransferase